MHSDLTSFVRYRLLSGARLNIMLVCCGLLIVLGLFHIVSTSYIVLQNAAGIHLTKSLTSTNVDLAQRSAAASEKLLAKILTQTVETPSLRLWLGLTYMVQGHEREAFKVWRETDGIFEQILHRGDVSWSIGDYSDAAEWYRRAIGVSVDLVESFQKFRYVISSLYVHKMLPATYPSDVVVVHSLADQNKLDASDLQWMNTEPHWNLYSGDRLASHPASDTDAGIMWWRGVAIAVLDVSEASSYQLTIPAKSRTGIPLKMQVQLDRQMIANFDVAGESWQEFSTIVTFRKGINVLGIELLEDTGDLMLDDLHLELLASG
jgi:hypothetical protein